MLPPTNLRFIRRSRKPPRAGDVFVMQVPDGRYLYGRVIGTELPSGRAPMPGAYLLYIFDLLGESKDVDISALKPTSLLIPPVFTNRMGWTRGYFETIAGKPLEPGDLLEQHCFWDVLREKYVDDNGRVIPGPIEPCGDWGLVSYLGIDDLISEALGIPPVPANATDE